MTSKNIVFALIAIAIVSLFMRVGDMKTDLNAFNVLSERKSTEITQDNAELGTFEITSLDAEPVNIYADIEPAAGDSKKDKESGDSKEEEVAENTEDGDVPKEDIPAYEEYEDTPESLAALPEWRDASDVTQSSMNVKKEVFEELSKRRADLDDREGNIKKREAFLEAAEQELKRKYVEMQTLRDELEILLGKQTEEEKARIDSLVKVYENMKPKDAARIFDTLDLDILLEVAAKMSERKLSPILAAMNAERARTITIMLAEEMKLPEGRKSSI